MQSTAVIVWWAALSLVSVLNIALWARAAKKNQGHQLTLSAVFVFVCAFRSFLPRAEGQRFCLYDSWISDAPIARILATAAELAFVAQVALVLHACARLAGSRGAAAISRLLVPLVAIAELFSWYTALTTNFIGSVFEESTWALTFTLAIIGFALVRHHFAGNLRALVTAAIFIAAGYVLFMCTVDVPMYWHRFTRDEAAGQHYLSVAAGWADSWSRRVVTLRWEDWRQEMPWMSLYFSVAVWLSIAMTFTPRWLGGNSVMTRGGLPD
jgi:hypothetical protein